MPHPPLGRVGIATLFLLLATACPNALGAQGAQALFQQGQTLEAQGKTAEAIAAYTKAIEADPKFSEAYRRRALVRASTGDRQGALTDFTRAIEADPRSARAYNGRASSRMVLKDYAGANKDLDSALAFDPNYGNAWSNRGRIKMETGGDLRSALADLNKSVEVDPKNRTSYWVRAEIRARLNDARGAISDFTTAFEFDPRDSGPLVRRADIKADLKEWRGAMSDYDSALKVIARSVPALYGRGKVLAATGDAKGAERDFKAALSINPNVPEVRLSLDSLLSPQKVAALIATPDEPPSKAQPAAAAPVAPKAAAAAAAAPVAPKAAAAPARAAAPAAAARVGADSGRVMVSALPSELASAVETLSAARDSASPDVPWRETTRRRVTLPVQSAPATMPPALDITKLSIEQFNGAVSTAMEQMRLLQGQLSAEETKRFEKKWAPLFDAPTGEVIDYFNKLNPLLAEFISVRSQIELGAEEYRASVVAAGISADFGDEESTRESLDIAAQQKVAIEAQQARLAELLAKIQDLGNPPDPVAAKRRARAKHEQAMKVFSNAPPYAEMLGVWVGEMLPLRQRLDGGAFPLPKQLDRGAMVVGFFEGTYQPGLHTQMQLAPGVKLPWDRPELVVHHPVTGAITYLTGYGFAAAYEARMMSDGEPLGVMWSPGDCIVGPWGSAEWSEVVSTKEPRLRQVEVHGDEMTAIALGRRGDDVYRVSLRRVRSGEGTDPDGFDPGTAERIRTDLDSLEATLKELAARGQSSSTEYRQLNAKRDSLSWRTVPVRNYNLWKSYFVRLLQSWKPQSPADLDDPSRAVDRAWRVLQDAIRSAPAAAPKARAAPAAAPPAAPVAEEPPAAPEMSPEMRAQEIADAKLRILSLEKDVEWYRKQLNTLKPEQLDFAELNLRSKQADIQQERDYIAYLQTGVYEHTRSPLDEWNFARGVASAEQDVLNAHITKQGTAALYKMVEMADPAQKEQLRAFINRQLTPHVLGSNDATKVKEIMDAVSNQVMGYQQKQGAKAEEAAVDEEEKEYWTKQAVTALGVAAGGVGAMAMTEAGITGIALQAGSMGIGAMYGAATGYVEGGPVQAVEQAAASTGLVAFGIIEGMKGYHEPVLDTLTGRPTGEVRGWWGAAERAGTSVITGWLIGKGVQVVAGLATSAVQTGLKKLRPLPPGGGPRMPTEAELAAATKSGRDAVTRYAALRDRLTTATKSNASKEEIAAINRQLEEIANEVDANYAAKSLLQEMQKTGSAADKYLAKDFRVRQKLLNRRVDQQFELDRTNGKGGTEGIHYEEWTEQGWVKRPLRFRDIRNASSGRKLNMDRDKALVEHPLFGPGLDGKMRPVARNWVYNKDGTPRMPRFRLVDGNGKRITMAKANEQLQATFNKSYRTVTGQSPEAAFQTLTSTANTEAYRDLRWIRDLSDVRNIRILDAAGASSAREVATFKGYHSGDPALAPILQARETARASSKEIKLRLLNIIKGMKNVSPAAKEQSLQHWQELSDALDGYVENPIKGYQKLRSLTGKSLAETMADIGYAIDAGIRFGKF